MGYDFEFINHQRIESACSHASCCHPCNSYHPRNVDFGLFHNITCYTNSLLSCIHVNTTKLLNITCTLVPTSMILRSLEGAQNTYLKPEVHTVTESTC